MSLFENLGKFTIRLLNSKHVFQRRLPFDFNPSVKYAGVRVSADDLRGLPEKPKKPLTPYFRFLAEMRPEYKKENPDCKVTDIVKLIADKWERIPMESKQKYMEGYKKDLVTYSNARLRYEEQLTDEQKQLMKRAKEETEIAKENRKLKKKMRELGKPKKPPTPFLIFFNSKVNSRGETPYKEWVRGVGKEWSNLPPELKAAYQKEYSNAVENHRRQIQEWEERMIRMGNIDVVRSEALIEPKTASRKVLRTRLITKNK